MDYKAILQLIKAVRSDNKGQGDHVDKLLDRFEALVSCHVDEEKVTSFEDLKQQFNQMQSCFEGFQEDYAKFCANTKQSPEAMQQYFSNSQNFTQKAWEELQGLNRKYGISEPHKETTQKSKRSKRSRKNKKKWATV